MLGVDVGGTSTVALAYDGVSARVATGPGANPNSSAARLSDALAGCLAELARGAGPSASDAPGTPHTLGAPIAAVIGAAGAGAAGIAELTREARAAWRRVGWAGEPVVVTDLEIAYHAGADAPDGLLLHAGTGAGACLFVDHRLTARADGMGWLLGDVGSAVWLGLRGLRAAAADLDRRGPATALTPAALALARGAADGGQRLSPGASDGVQDGARDTPDADPRQRLIAAARAMSPAELGAFAPAVTAHAQAGDQVAERIVARAARGLLRSARAAARTGAPTASPAAEPTAEPTAEPACAPAAGACGAVGGGHIERGHHIGRVVLSGSVLTTDNALAQRVRVALAAEFAVPIALASHPVVGAVAMAARAAGGWIDRDAVLAELLAATARARG